MRLVEELTFRISDGDNRNVMDAGSSTRRRLVVVAVALAAVTASALSACGNKAADEDVGPRMQASVDQIFAQYRASHELPDGAGVLVRLASPQGTWTVTSGMPEGTGADSHYRIASVSKTFTAASVMLLRQQGKLNLDDLVTQNIPGTTDSYLPATPQYAIPYKNQITIRQILSHRAGIFDVFNDPVPKTSKEPYAGRTYGEYMTQFSGPDHQFTVDELAGVLSADHLSFFKPGTDYHYSDTGYNLLVKSWNGSPELISPPSSRRTCSSPSAWHRRRWSRTRTTMVCRHRS